MWDLLKRVLNTLLDKIEKSRLQVVKLLVVLIPIIVVPIENMWDYFTYPKALVLWSLSLLLIPSLFLYYRRFKFISLQSNFYASIGFLLIILLSASFSNYQSVVWLGQLNVHNGAFTYCSFLLIFLTANSLKKHYLEIIQLIIFSLCIVSCIALLQYINVHLWEPDGIRVYWKRIYGTIGNANWLSGSLLLAIPLAIYFENRKEKKFVWRIAIIIISSALFANGTRGGYLGLFLIILIWLTKNLLLRRTKTIIAPLICIIIGFTIANFKNYYPIQRMTSMHKNIERGLHGDLSAGEHRLFIYKSSIPLIKKYGILGAGPDTFGKVYQQDRLEKILIKEHGAFKNPARRLNIAHNEYIQLSITIGVLGLIFYLFFVIKGAVNIFNRESLFNFYLGLSVIGYSVHLMFTDSNIGVATIFWVLIGLSQVRPKEKR